MKKFSPTIVIWSCSILSFVGCARHTSTETEVIAGVETSLSAKMSVAPGTLVRGQCTPVTEDGRRLSPIPIGPSTAVFSPEEALLAESGVLIAHRAGEVRIACRIMSGGSVLRDETPERLQVHAGIPSITRATVSPARVTAGATVSVQCSVLDSFENELEAAAPAVEIRNGPAVVSGPPGEPIQVTAAGPSEVRCILPDAVPEVTILNVEPDLPARFELGLEGVPRPFYESGNIVTLRPRAYDQFENFIHSSKYRVAISHAPEDELPQLPLFYRLLSETTHQFRAQVISATLEGRALEATLGVPVNRFGPRIRCNLVGGANYVRSEEGAIVQVTGEISDPNGLFAVTSTLGEVMLDENGTFVIDWPAQFGINQVPIQAVDLLGRGVERTCVFLVAEQLISMDGKAPGSRLALGPEMFDDQNTRNNFKSLKDRLLEFLIDQNEPQLRLRAALSQNPVLLSTGCRVNCPLSCCLNLGLVYRNITVVDSNASTANVELRTGGASVAIGIGEIVLELETRGTFTQTFTVHIDRIDVQAGFDLDLDAQGNLLVAITHRTVTLGNINIVMSGLPGPLQSVVGPLVTGIFQNDLEGRIRGAIESFIDDLPPELEDKIADLNPLSKGASVNIPRLTGGPDIELRFSFAADRLAIDSSEALLELGVGVSATPANIDPGLIEGAPVRSEVDLQPWPNTDPMRFHAQISRLLSQTLYALWRAGWLDFEVDGGRFHPSGAGIHAKVHASLPPVAVLEGDRISVALAGLQATMTATAIGTEVRTATVSVVASAAMEINSSGDLVFSDLIVEVPDIYSEDLPLDTRDRESFEDWVRSVVDGALRDSLGRQLPPMPLPDNLNILSRSVNHGNFIISGAP